MHVFINAQQILYVCVYNIWIVLGIHESPEEGWLHVSKEYTQNIYNINKNRYGSIPITADY